MYQEINLCTLETPHKTCIFQATIPTSENTTRAATQTRPRLYFVIFSGAFGPVQMFNLRTRYRFVTVYTVFTKYQNKNPHVQTDTKPPIICCIRYLQSPRSGVVPRRFRPRCVRAATHGEALDQPEGNIHPLAVPETVHLDLNNAILSSYTYIHDTREREREGSHHTYFYHVFYG